MLENIELFGNSLGVDNESVLQNIFDVIHPVGEIYVQYPQQSSPIELYNNSKIKSVWEEQLQYDSAFFRANKGTGDGTYIYKVSNETQYYAADINGNPTIPVKAIADNGGTITLSQEGASKIYDGKTYLSYKINGANNSAAGYINETNGLSKQDNQNKYHRHSGSGTTTNESRGHVHYLSSGDGNIGGWQSTSSGYTGADGSWSFSIRYADYGGGDEDLLVLSNISNISIEAISGSNKTRVARSSEGSKASNTRSISRANHSHGVGFNNGSYTSGCHQTHTHSYSFDTSYNGSSTDTESRPDNFTIRIWKRIS